MATIFRVLSRKTPMKSTFSPGLAGFPSGEQRLRKTVSNALQNRVPRFNSGRGLQINRQVGSSAAAPNERCRRDQIGPHIEGEAPRELLVVPRCLFQHRCLQTSCWVVQLRLQVPVLVDAAGFVATAPVLGMQEFWQFIACVSQLT